MFTTSHRFDKMTRATNGLKVRNVDGNIVIAVVVITTAAVNWDSPLEVPLQALNPQLSSLSCRLIRLKCPLIRLKCPLIRLKCRLILVPKLRRLSPIDRSLARTLSSAGLSGGRVRTGPVRGKHSLGLQWTALG